MSSIEESIIARIRSRAEFGLLKYGTTLERSDYTLHEWVAHAQEEAMDLANYLECIRKSLMGSLVGNPSDELAISALGNVLRSQKSAIDTCLMLEEMRGKYESD